MTKYQRYKDKIKAYYEKHKAKIDAWNRDFTDCRRFGVTRQQVFDLYGDSCARCGMTNAEHKNQFSRSITIHHKDGQGRYSALPNNEVENFEVLCLRCHGSKDGQRGGRPTKEGAAA